MAKIGIVSQDLQRRACEIKREFEKISIIASIANEIERCRQRLIANDFGERGPEIRGLDDTLRLLALYAEDTVG